MALSHSGALRQIERRRHRLLPPSPRRQGREELETKYGADAKKLVSVKPGLIGWWAANGRSNCTYESGERQKLELYYVDHCSLGFDIKIVFKTIGSVLRGDGAQ